MRVYQFRHIRAAVEVTTGAARPPAAEARRAAQGHAPGASISGGDPAPAGPADTGVLMTSSSPSRGEDERSFFDRFAGAVAAFASRAPFFAACVLLVLIWAPSYFALRNVDTWQLLINTATTIVTFLLVALLQNTQRRSEEAIQAKLNAIADGLADLMEHQIEEDPVNLRGDIADLKDAVGLEDRI